MSVEFRMIEPFDYSSVISAFDQLPTENTQYVFDTTGGSNFFIAVAGHYAAFLPQENEIRIYDINKQICHSSSEEKSRKITLPKLKVEEVIKIHNSSVIKEPDSLIRHTISDADLKILERLWELASRAPAQWNRFMQSARIMYPSKKINGKNVVKINDTVLNDVVTGVYLDWDTEKNKSNDETTNEIDVIATAGCIPIVGFNMGAGLKKRVRELFTKLLIAEASVGLAALFIVELFPQQLINIFGAANESQYYTDFAIHAFRIYLCMMVFACVNKACFIFLQAMGKAVESTALSVIREIVFGVGLALILPIFFGLDGVLYSMPVSDILTFTIALFLIVRTYKEIGKGKNKAISGKQIQKV